MTDRTTHLNVTDVAALHDHPRQLVIVMCRQHYVIAPAALMYRYCHFSVSLLVEINQRRSSLFLFEQAETRFQTNVIGIGSII